MSSYPNTKQVSDALAQFIFDSGGRIAPKDAIEPLADKFSLSNALRSARKNSDKRLLWDNHVHWARLELANQGIIDKSIHGHWVLTKEGLDLFRIEGGRSKASASRLAMDDLETEPNGNSDPEYRKRISGSYVRDAKVRRDVLKRAQGKCEFCGDSGFIKWDGTIYLETHHVIALSAQGPDTLANVIALCANDHRRAHFDRGWQELQIEFKQILDELGS